MRAFTLFEMLIVLALLSAIMLLIGLTLDIHMRQMTGNRTEVEQAQLARTLLNKIAQEIRSVVVPLREETLEIDTAALNALMGLEDFSDLLSDPSVEDGGENTEDTGDDEEYEQENIYGVVPGIYGDIDWIQIDTAKLPRGELFGSRQVRRGTSFAADRLSASKTVLYYLGADTGQLSLDDPRYQPEKLIGSIGRSLDINTPQYGLFRRELDRQVMQYAIQEGIEREDEQYDEPIAPEIEWIEFAYFDPTLTELGMTGDWITEWDMDDRQMLPTAVRITIAIRRPALNRGLLSRNPQNQRAPVIYSLIVPIPVTIDVPDEVGATEYIDE